MSRPVGYHRLRCRRCCQASYRFLRGNGEQPTGRTLAQNEFAAIVGACDHVAKTTNKDEPIKGCLADFGLRTVQ